MKEYIEREAALNFEAEITADPSEIQAISQGMSLYAEHIKAIPAADVAPVVRCRNCVHYDKDHFQMFEGVPVIVAHHVCRFWGRGCVTRPDGFCYRGEPKEGGACDHGERAE